MVLHEDFLRDDCTIGQLEVELSAVHKIVLLPDSVESEGVGGLVEDERDKNAEIHATPFVRRNRMITTAVQKFRDQITVRWKEVGSDNKIRG